MNSTSYLLCVRCEQIARFICGRCSDPYCSKTCQIMHWPIHRTMCMSIPSLLEITNPILPTDIKKSNNPVLPCYNSDQRKKNNINSFFGRNGDQSHMTQIQDKNDLGDHIRSEDAKKSNPQHCVSNDVVKWKQPNPMRERTHSYMWKESQKCDESMESRKYESTFSFCDQEAHQSKGTQCDGELLDLQQLKKKESGKSGKPIPLYVNGPQRSVSKESLKWDEPTTGSFFGSQNKWQQAFPLPENTTEVTVQYFIDNPTTSCWVVQSQHVKEKMNLLDETKQLHCNDEGVGENEIRTNEVYCVHREGMYHRGIVVYQTNTKEVVVFLIDDGRSFQTHISAIKQLNPRLKSINAFAVEINFKPAVNVGIGQVLHVEKVSIDALGAIFVKFGKEENIEEIEWIPLPIGVPLELFCLDHSNIENGYISACKHDPRKIESINNLSDKIHKYFRKFDKVDKYFPKIDETCLVYHDDEKQWYRAECVKLINSNCFEVLFIDYGNMRIVKSSSVRKIVTEFMEPAIMHLCRIYGVPQKPSIELTKKINSFFVDNQIFSITRVDDLDGVYIIHCPELLKAIE